MLIIGSHVSFKKDDQLLGSLKESLSYGANTFMFYTGAPQNTNRSKIDENITKEAHKLMKENNIDKEKVIIHAPYIINLATSNEENWNFAIRFLKEEIDRAIELDIRKIVLHPGSSVGITKEVGISNIASALDLALKDKEGITICLETMAGKGNEVGSSFEEIKKIIDLSKEKEKLGVCLDTCHINDAGYDITNFDAVLESFDKIIGLDRLKCVHINDSINIKGAKKDRHANFGFGTLGFTNLIKIIYHEKLKDIPKILETPYITENEKSKERLYPPYKFEIEMIKNKKFDEKLLETIREYYKR